MENIIMMTDGHLATLLDLILNILHLNMFIANTSSLSPRSAGAQKNYKSNKKIITSPSELARHGS